MALGEIKEEEAFYLFSLYTSLHEMLLLRLLTQEQYDELHEALNGKLHEALGLSSSPIDFTDEFNEPDGPPSNWTLYKGTWAVVSNVLKQSTSGISSYAFLNDPLAVEWANYRFEADIRADTSVTNNVFGIIGRYKNKTSNYTFYYSKYRNMLCLDKGTTSILENAKTLVYNQWYRFKIELVGMSVKCYLDNVLEFDWLDFDSIPAGVPTLYCANPHSFDNVRIVGI